MDVKTDWTNKKVKNNCFSHKEERADKMGTEICPIIVSKLHRSNDKVQPPRKTSMKHIYAWAKSPKIWQWLQVSASMTNTFFNPAHVYVRPWRFSEAAFTHVQAVFGLVLSNSSI